jgi:hypothetical protein
MRVLGRASGDGDGTRADHIFVCLYCLRQLLAMIPDFVCMNCVRMLRTAFQIALGSSEHTRDWSEAEGSCMEQCISRGLSAFGKPDPSSKAMDHIPELDTSAQQDCMHHAAADLQACRTYWHYICTRYLSVNMVAGPSWAWPGYV